MRSATLALAALVLVGCSQERDTEEEVQGGRPDETRETPELTLFTAFELTPGVTPLNVLRDEGRVTKCVDVPPAVVCDIRRVSIGAGVDPISAKAIFKRGLLDGIYLLTLPHQTETVVGALVQNYGQPTGVSDHPNGEADYAWWRFRQGVLVYKFKDDEEPDRSETTFVVTSGILAQ